MRSGCCSLRTQCGYNTPTILGADREAGRSVLLLGACTRKEVRLYKLHVAVEPETASGADGGEAEPEAPAPTEASLELLGKVGPGQGEDSHHCHPLELLASCVAICLMSCALICEHA